VLRKIIHDLGTPAADSVAGQQTQIFHISTATRAQQQLWISPLLILFPESL